MKLNWEHVSENFYSVSSGGKELGTLQRGRNYNWILDIPSFNIHQENQDRQELMQYAEKKVTK